LVELLKVKVEDVAIESPLVEEDRWGVLTIFFADLGGHRPGTFLVVEVFDSETLPVSKKLDNVFTGLLTADLKTENLDCWLDVEEAMEPVHMHVRFLGWVLVVVFL
jgi:hypothetical protein